MTEDSSNRTVYEITPESIRPPWVNRGFLRLLRQRREVPRQRVGAACVAAALAVMMHVFLLGSVIWGGEGDTRHLRPDRQGIGATASVSTADPVMTLILIPDAGPQAQSPDEVLASRGKDRAKNALLIASPDPMPAVDLAGINEAIDRALASPRDAGDSAALAALYGRYMGQIQARIERAWMRPRTPIGAGVFDCSVQILQDSRGAVMEVALEHCNGDTQWQLSLVEAIQSASPLPAPPNPGVFAQAVTLQFKSQGYSAGGGKEGFEPERPTPSALNTGSLAPWLTPPGGDSHL
jgi:hypothetical protein